MSRPKADNAAVSATYAGLRQLPLPVLVALAAVAVPDHAVLVREVADDHVQHFGPTASGERQGQDDRAVPQPDRRPGDHAEQLANVVAGQSPRRADLDSRPLQRVARVGGDDVHADQEAVEGTEAGEPGTDRDGRWLLAGGPNAVAPGEDLGASDAIGRLSDGAEEVLQHAAVADDGAPAAAASLLLGEEGVEAALPAFGCVVERRDRLHGAPPP